MRLDIFRDTTKMVDCTKLERECLTPDFWERPACTCASTSTTAGVTLDSLSKLMDEMPPLPPLRQKFINKGRIVAEFRDGRLFASSDAAEKIKQAFRSDAKPEPTLPILPFGVPLEVDPFLPREIAPEDISIGRPFLFSSYA